MVIETELQEHETRIQKLEGICLELTTRLANIEGSTKSIELILKFVVLPLIVILGGLVGVKIALPSS